LAGIYRQEPTLPWLAGQRESIQPIWATDPEGVVRDVQRSDVALRVSIGEVDERDVEIAPVHAISTADCADIESVVVDLCHRGYEIFRQRNIRTSGIRLESGDTTDRWVDDVDAAV
jgi:hypothetical protein